VRSLDLTLLPAQFAVCRLEPAAPIPDWAMSGEGFCSLTCTAGELSIVCAEDAVPSGVRCEREWRVFRIEGPFDFSAVGILVSAAAPLAEAGVPIFAISTFDTDYLLVKEQNVGRAASALEAVGHRVKL
jgi:hypothetical protein